MTGSIAAYKAIGLLRLLTQQGASVQVVMTESATRFIAPLTFEVLSGSSVTSDLFSGHQDYEAPFSELNKLTYYLWPRVLPILLQNWHWV